MGLDNVGIGFILVTAAGLATCIGAATVYTSWFVKIANKTFLAGALAISAGVMLFVSFVEIFFKSNDAFAEHGYKSSQAFALATALFFAGIIFIQLIDLLVHRISNYHDDLDAVCEVVLEENEQKLNRAKRDASPAGGTVVGDTKAAPRRASSITGLTEKNGETDIEMRSEAELSPTSKEDPHSEGLKKMGLMTALAIGIHNLPEGLATFLGALDDPTVGAALAIAIGIHNIPEGLCVAIPIFYSTGSRHKAFFWAFVSGITEPIGALIGYGVVVAAGGEISPLAYGILFGLVGGMMVSICIKGLLPTAFKYDPKDKVITICVVIGMFIMALSLVLFGLATDEDDDGCAPE